MCELCPSPRRISFAERAREYNKSYYYIWLQVQHYHLLQGVCLVWHLDRNLQATGCNFTGWTPWAQRWSFWSGGSAKSEDGLECENEWLFTPCLSSNNKESKCLVLKAWKALLAFLLRFYIIFLFAFEGVIFSFSLTLLMKRVGRCCCLSLFISMMFSGACGDDKETVLSDWDVCKERVLWSLSQQGFSWMGQDI